MKEVNVKEHKVYHIRVVGNEDLAQGYVGVTGDIAARMRSHKHSGMLNSGREFVLIHSGSQEECYAIEAKLRPEENMGWNKGRGGYRRAGNIKTGERISIDTEIKQGQHLSRATEFKKGTTPHNKGNGKDYIFTSPTGEEYLVTCITDFCIAHNLTPQNMRKVARGLRVHHKGWIASHVQTGR
ncbi:putative homing endonuclease [Lelliottia phage phD2B]|uniref:Putative homing endonuclease n=1 Tax=Lelliottia phage phD2B TaxID=1542498 RepID=A0A088FS47_9CAUD|nr:putative homing endonuclease [Lelliottia phage phD2B]AIM51268.1 putative homing endonuclease [Lelliottia phage phD2B]